MATPANRWRFALQLLFGFALAGGLMHFALLAAGIDGWPNLLMVACLLGPTFMTGLVAFRSGSSAVYTRARLLPRRVVALLYALPTAAIVIMLLEQDVSLETFVYATFVVGATSVSGLHEMSKYRYAHVLRTISLDDPRKANELVDECRQGLLEPGLTEDQRASAELNLAGALTLASSVIATPGLARRMSFSPAGCGLPTPSGCSMPRCCSWTPWLSRRSAAAISRDSKTL